MKACQFAATPLHREPYWELRPRMVKRKEGTGIRGSGRLGQAHSPSIQVGVLGRCKASNAGPSHGGGDGGDYRASVAWWGRTAGEDVEGSAWPGTEGVAV